MLFVCVGSLFGKLIFFNYTRFCFGFFLLFPFFSFLSHGSIHGDGETIYYLTYLPDLPLRTEITDAMTSLFTNNNTFTCYLPSCHQLVSNAVSPPPEILKIAHLKLCAYLDRGVGS